MKCVGDDGFVSVSDPEETKDIELTVQTLRSVSPGLPEVKKRNKHKLCCIL